MSKPSNEMTKFYLIAILTILSFSGLKAQENVGIGTHTPDPKAVLDVASEEKGLLIPRMNSLLRLQLCNNNSTCEEGMMVYDTDLQQLWYWDADAVQWKQASGAQRGDWGGICIYNSSNHNNIGNPCDHLMRAPVTGIGTCQNGWTWINVSASSQNSGSANTNHWTGACLKD